MTTRAVARVPVDWQVEVTQGAHANQVLQQVRAQPHVQTALPVSFMRTPHLTATTNGSTQTTGQARVLGLPTGYARAFPGELRVLSGSLKGPLLFQQTAANLRARPGDVVSVARPGNRPAKVRVAGIVDLPAEDSLFQQVGAPVGAQPQAPPDNVLILPQRDFGRIAHGVPSTQQIHVGLSHNLSGSPSAAFSDVSGAARNLETKLAGAGLVGNNVGVA
ncbi:MAG TPA: hypothetical protein VH300_16995, partial [Thermoleophilaceae bacterium]|nr:hypothetical protein [Thermoleophilaceae bacterium]